MEDGEPIKQIETPKNKWLYPTDEYGKMERGKVYESQTYESGIIENKTEEFTIISASAIGPLVPTINFQKPMIRF